MNLSVWSIQIEIQSLNLDVNKQMRRKIVHPVNYSIACKNKVHKKAINWIKKLVNCFLNSEWRCMALPTTLMCRGCPWSCPVDQVTPDPAVYLRLPSREELTRILHGFLKHYKSPFHYNLVSSFTWLPPDSADYLAGNYI